MHLVCLVLGTILKVLVVSYHLHNNHSDSVDTFSVPSIMWRAFISFHLYSSPVWYNYYCPFVDAGVGT